MPLRGPPPRTPAMPLPFVLSPSPWRQALAALGLLGALWAAPGAQAQDASTAPEAKACPPPLATPTAEQMQASARSARDRCFLWRLSKDGRSAWLFGTIHVGRLDWIFPGPQLRAALTAADTLALEIDISDPAIARQAAELSRAPADLPPWPAALRDRVARQVALACLPAQVLDGQHPVMQAMTLTVLAGRWDGLEAPFAQELVLSGMAKAQAKPLVSLESVALQMGVLIPADPAKAVALTDHTLAQLEQGKARSMLGRLARIWEQSDLDELTHYERWCECVDSADDRALLKRLNDDRNPKLAAGIDALHAQGKAVFAAVGALHMVGEQGLPKLMRERGYSLERVSFAPN